MTYSEIKITFRLDFQVGYILNIFNSFSSSEVSTVWVENWVNMRSQTKEVSVGEPVMGLFGQRAAINFVNAFFFDYNYPSQYVVTRVGNVVTIKSMIPDQLFVSGNIIFNGEEIDAAVFEINNFVGTPYELDEITFSSATDACTKIRVGIKTTNLTTKIVSPFQLSGNTNNPFYFDAFREQGMIIILENATGQQLNFNVFTPGVLHKDNFVFTPSNTPNGGTLSISKNNSFGLNVEYSLNGTDWQIEPYFSGLEAGTYSLYVKDQYRCSFNIQFFISEFNIQTPYFYYSKSNSIRIAERVDFALIQKNDENTLSCETICEFPYKEIQRFNSGDNITAQFKSNLSVNTAKIVDEQSNETNLVVIKKTDNIGNKEKRDAVIYRYNDFKSGIYFINGNLYNYDSNVITGTYALNGLLPIWAEIGKYIVIDSSWYLIENISFEESKNADVLIISKVTSELIDVSVIVGSIYNIQDYEVYETTVIMGGFFNQNIRLKIESSDDEFSSKTYLSEVINVEENHEFCLEIIYFNIDNNDVFYQTEIQHLLRLPYYKINGYFDDSSENNKTDSTVVSLSATLYEGNEFIFEPVTKEIWRKLAIALSHKFVFIDDVGYVKDGEIEVEGPLDDTNLYVVKAKMLKTGKVYSNLSVGSIILANDPIIEIPGMIEWDGGFIEQ